MTKSVDTFMNAPWSYCDQSVTQMHSIPRDELLELQRQAMVRRVAEHRESIEMVGKLAARLDVTHVDEFDDVVPLLFAHTPTRRTPPPCSTTGATTCSPSGSAS